jgi:hypothetical protein
MKRIFTLFCLSLVFLACNQSSLPKGIMDEEKMVKVLMDVHITDSYLNQVYQRDTLLMQAHARYNYIFKKYQIDSATLTKNIKYYSLRPKLLSKMYQTIQDSLQLREDSKNPKPLVDTLVKGADKSKDDLPAQ